MDVLRNRQHYAAMIIGLMVGVGGAQIAESWYDSFSPKVTHVESVDVMPLTDGGYLLTVTLEAPKTSCLRVTEHLITPMSDARSEGPPGSQVPPGVPQYEPLAGAVAGSQFNTGGKVAVVMKVHPDMVRPDSTWYYVYRAAYMCVRWPGLVSTSEWQSKPFPVHFD